MRQRKFDMDIFLCVLHLRMRITMIRVNQIRMPIEHSQDDIKTKTAKILNIKKQNILAVQIVKKSIDARKKPELYVTYTVDVKVENEKLILSKTHSNQVQKCDEKPYVFPGKTVSNIENRPVIIGTGPAGLFCGYMLAKHGYQPILLERGNAAPERKKDVEEFWKSGCLKPDSNVQFGEGGAGTFSDGKLNTLIKDRFGRGKEVLRIFVQSGAPEHILYEAKPHVGTDQLIGVVKNLREKIKELGGEVRFGAKVIDVLWQDNITKGVVLESGEEIYSNTVVLAIGHSARDTFEMLFHKNLSMEAKAFAVGLRMEHPRKLINKLQYGVEEQPILPTASYKVTTQTKSGRGVYSFCMCPGGYVVNASSEQGHLAVNGMSYSGRSGVNSNSAMIVTVTPEDYGGTDALSGIAFQRELEKRAYEIGGGQIPVERYGDFYYAVTGEKMQEESVIEKKYAPFMPAMKGNYKMADVHAILPERLNKALVEGIQAIGRTMPGFSDGGAFLSGVESRTSSPIRISRDDTGQSSIRGLYPCGEGAGYAGGITSAAMDGIYIAEKIAQNLEVLYSK